jgi:hypothetical protein
VLNEKDPKPADEVLPWASGDIIPWIYSMIAISAGKRTSAAQVNQPKFTPTNSRLWSKDKN